MGTKQRDKSSELIPAGIKLTPFLKIITALAGPVKLLCRLDIAVLHAKSAYIHGPIRDAAHCEIKSGGNLRLHILPTCSDIT